METRTYEDILIVNLNEEIETHKPEVHLIAILNPESGCFEEKNHIRKIDVFNSIFAKNIVSIVQKYDMVFISRKQFDGNIMTQVYIGQITL